MQKNNWYYICVTLLVIIWFLIDALFLLMGYSIIMDIYYSKSIVKFLFCIPLLAITLLPILASFFLHKRIRTAYRR